jgi:hypothetical protein
MKTAKSSGSQKFWKATFESNEHSKDSDDENSEYESPRNNIIDSFNLYSALDKEHKNKLENTASYLPPINEIAKKYRSVKLLTQMPNSKQKNEDTIFDLPDSRDLKKFTRFHITDANLVREKSAIEKSVFYSLNKKLEKRKGQACSKKRLTIADTANFNNRKQLLEAVNNSLPDVKTVYKNESGLESRMNSFYHENLKRINKHPVPFCEYAREHASHEKDKRKAVHINCVFCADQIEGKVGALAPENSFIEDHHNNSKPKTPKTPKIPRKLPILKFNQNIQQYQLLNNNNQNYNQAISSLNPPDKTKKTFFCDVLGEKYCLGCIECHERRFAKVFESKYMNESDPLLVTMNLLINQRTIKPLS